MLSLSLLAAALPVALATPLVERATTPVSVNAVACANIQASLVSGSASFGFPGVYLESLTVDFQLTAVVL